MVTLPAHELFEVSTQGKFQAPNQVDSQYRSLIISSLDDVFSFINQAANQATNQALSVLDEEVHDKVLPILKGAVNWIKREDLFNYLELSNQTYNRKKYLDPLISIGWVQLEYPEIPTHPNQRYKITDIDRRLLSLLNKQ